MLTTRTSTALASTLVAILLSGSIAGCAGSRLDPVLAPSSDSIGYATTYPETVDAVAARFSADRQRAHELSAALPGRAKDLKEGSESELLLEIVDEADRAGRTQRMRRAYAEERSVAHFWDDERGPISARVNSAAQKQLSESGCTQADVQGAVGSALRDGMDRQLERRVREANEAQRTIDQQRARLAPGSVAATQRLADEIALASHLVYVGLLDDLRELDEHLREQSAVKRTLERALDEERAIQAEPKNAADQRASQERVVQIEKSRAALEPAVARAEAARADYEAQLEAARKEYEQALEAVRAHVRAMPPTKRAS